MSNISILELKEKFEIQAYQNIKNLDKEANIPFSGSPRKHPFDKSKVILVADPFTENTFYYEFKAKDIAGAEELSSITNLKGESIPMARIWVKKKSVAVQCTPFIVDAIRHN